MSLPSTEQVFSKRQAAFSGSVGGQRDFHSININTDRSLFLLGIVLTLEFMCKLSTPVSFAERIDQDLC